MNAFVLLTCHTDLPALHLPISTVLVLQLSWVEYFHRIHYDFLTDEMNWKD